MSRRTVLRTGSLLGTAAVVGLPSISRAATAPARTDGTTLASRYVRGVANEGGYRKIVTAPGEPHVVRSDLGAVPRDGRVGTRVALAAFAHLTDVHIIDAQSPMRVEFLDRLDDAYQPGDPTLGGFLSSSYRPQEMLTAQTSDAMVQAINRVGVGPVTGAPLDFAIQTGDNSDNCQYNEVRWNIDVLDGTKVRPDSGNLTKWEGVHDNATLDTHYWHPEGGRNDVYRQRFGFPTKPGLLDAARRPFTPQGLDMPWYSVFGNHDGLVQGNFPHTLSLGLIGTGPLKPTALPPGLSQADVIASIRQANAAPLVGALSLLSSARLVTADAGRRSLSRRQVVEEHFKTTGTPVGHGFQDHNRFNGTAWYHFDQGPLRCIALDTVNPNGYADGSIDGSQVAWLADLLSKSKDRYVMIFSHHTSRTMTNPLVLTGLDLELRVLGDTVVTLLKQHPQVIAWVNGHTHRNEITAHRSADGTSGFYEINSASHVDFPQQSRLVELADNRDGTLSIFTTMVDHAGAAAHGGSFGDPLALASLARELSANDPQHRDDGYSGSPQDRNVELVLDDPLR